MTLVIFLAALIGGMLIGLPICFALLFSGVCMMLYLNGFNAQILSQNLFSGADSFSMMAVPFFIMAGEFMNRGGITKRIVNAANAIIGHVRGGLGYVAIMAILLFASMIGSAVAVLHECSRRDSSENRSRCFPCIPWSDPHSYDGTCRL